ncbi:MAG: hypothetical protein ACR2PI_06850 [Hyphomicrobiaceae bacterium]
MVDELTIDHDPRALLGEFVLRGYAECQRRGVRLSFAPIEILTEINQRHRESWAPLLSIFDHRFDQLKHDNSFCIVGRNDSNEIIYTRAARLYRLGPGEQIGNFAELTEQMHHLYGRPSDAANENESWTLSGPAAEAMKSISGRVVFSGAVWCHPTFRKLGFTSIASSIGRACSQAIWNNDHTVTFMAKSVVDGGHAEKTGYSNVSWTVHARNASIGDLDIAFLWMGRDEALKQIEKMLRTTLSQDNRTIVDRGGKQKSLFGL